MYSLFTVLNYTAPPLWENDASIKDDITWAPPWFYLALTSSVNCSYQFNESNHFYCSKIREDLVTGSIIFNYLCFNRFSSCSHLWCNAVQIIQINDQNQSNMCKHPLSEKSFGLGAHMTPKPQVILAEKVKGYAKVQTQIFERVIVLNFIHLTKSLFNQNIAKF